MSVMVARVLLRAARVRYKAHPTRAAHALVLHRLYQLVKARGATRPRQPTGVSPAGVAMIAEFEGFSARRYDDGMGVQTIGYGTTAADVSPLPVSLTEPAARALLRERLNRKYLPPVLRALAPMHPTQNMVDAAVSFAYNLGEGAFQGSRGFETLTRALHAADRRAVAQAFLLYDNPNDPAVHAGLKRRRQAEHDLFLKGA